MSDEHSIDLYAPETQENWYPTYQKLRDENPVYQMPGSKIFVISRYQDVLHVLRHQEIFRTGTTATRSGQSAEIYKNTGWERITPLSVNPPEHRQYRDLVDHHFDASGSLRWLSFIESTVHELIDEFAGPGISAGGKTEFVQAFAIPLPVRAITRILGFPASDIPQLKEWSTAWVLPFSGPLTAEQDNWVATKVVEFQHYINHAIEEKRINPGDDVISDLTTAMYNGERLLTNHEIITIVDHLYIGGNETTTFAITSALWILLRQPGLYDTVYNDRSLVEQFLEESMRLESPTQGLYRSVAADTEIAGVTIPAGSTVHIRYAAANRDDSIFPNADQVDLTRSNTKRHMAFSLGEHHCPGSGLSRLEQKTALNVVLDRLPHLRLAPDTNDFTHMPGFVLRALNELHLEWGDARAI